MAIQSEIFSTAFNVRTFASTKYIATKQHMAIWLKRVSDKTWTQLSVNEFELINNSAVLIDAPSSSIYSMIEIRVADEPNELGSSQSVITIVASLESQIQELVDTVIPNINEILLADDNATIATTKASEASTSAGEASASVLLAEQYANSVGEGCVIVETIEELFLVNTVVFNNTAIVKDLNRGGTFIWSATGTANGGTVFAGATGYWNRQYSGAVNVKWFGAKGDGITDDTVAIEKAIIYANQFNSLTIKIPAGEFIVNNLTLENLENISIIGDGKESSIIKLSSGNLVLKSPRYTSISNLTISGNFSDTIVQSIYISNYSNISITSCYFKGFGGETTNKAGSTIIFLYAGDTTTSNVNGGSSEGALITMCDFSGSSRKTNFAIRVYTEFEGTQTSTNIGTRINNCSFGGFNWNAVEIAGSKTSHVIVTDCVANMCGLTPFDIDKGANNCLITNCTINRLLGNIDTDVNPQTAVTCVGVQGRYSYEFATYSYNNIVTDIVVNLLANDIEAFSNEFCCASIAYSKDSTVKNIYIHCDRVPVSLSGDFKFAVIKHETAINCVFDNIVSTNAQIGIIQSAASATIGGENYTYPTMFKNIKNIGMMTGELIVADASGERVQLIFNNLVMKTDLSIPYKAAIGGFNFACHFTASGSSSHFAIIKDSMFTIPDVSSCYFALFNIAKLGLNNIKITGIPVGSRLLHSNGSTIPTNLGIKNVLASYGQNPIDLYTVLQYIDQTASINCGINEDGTIENNGATLFSSGIPQYPPVANYLGKYIIVENTVKTAGSFSGWVATSSGWKTFGAITA